MKAMIATASITPKAAQPNNSLPDPLLEPPGAATNPSVVPPLPKKLGTPVVVTPFVVTETPAVVVPVDDELVGIIVFGGSSAGFVHQPLLRSST